MNLKDVKKLGLKKYREETGLFIVEGRKNIMELLASDFELETLFFTLEASEEMENVSKEYGKKPDIVITTGEKLTQAGTLESNNIGIAVVKQKDSPLATDVLKKAQDECVLVLDDVRDPGNLGTIIRTADWFGITNVVTSKTSVDFYNPKVIAASMGSFTRVSVLPTDLCSFLDEGELARIPSYGAFLDGTDIHALPSLNHGLLVMGSESHGISNELQEYIGTRITIPKLGSAESLNVAVATGIILATLVRST